MAAGFRDLLAWLLAWKSTYTPTPGPYRVEDAQAACTGAVAGENYHAGATIGQNYHTGATAGMCNG
jgi:hypothetical protein